MIFFTGIYKLLVDIFVLQMELQSLAIALQKAPHTISPPIGFLDITGHKYSEVVISRVYNYFLSSRNNNKIAKLFITSLLEVIYKKTEKRLEISDYEVNIEVKTINNNFIDILIESTDGNKVDGEYAIIIENKIFHHLANDLKDYYKHSNAKLKVGVLLTLNPEPISEENYCNITHNEWMTKITEQGLPAGIQSNEYVYLNDFINNLKNLSKSTEMDEQTKFFFDNTQVILDAGAIHNMAYMYVINQIKIAGDKLGLPVAGGSGKYRCFWDTKSPVFYTLIIEELFTNKHELTIIIEFQKEALQFEEDIHSFLGGYKLYDSLDKRVIPAKHYKHFAQKTYQLDSKQLAILGQVIEEKIKTDFEPVMGKIKEFLISKGVEV